MEKRREENESEREREKFAQKVESSRDGGSKQPYVGWLRKVAGKHGARTVYRRDGGGGGHFAASTGTCSKNQSRGYVARKSGWSNEVKLRLVMSAGFRKDRSSSFYNGSKKLWWSLVNLNAGWRNVETGSVFANRGENFLNSFIYYYLYIVV